MHAGASSAARAQPAPTHLLRTRLAHVGCPPPAACAAIFWPTRGPRERWTRALLNFVVAVDPEGRRPLVFWAFSNGGAFPVGIANRLVQHDRRQAVEGWVAARVI